MKPHTVCLLAAALLLAGGCNETVEYVPTAAADLQLRFVDAVEPDSVQPGDFYGEVLIDQTDVEYLYIAEEEALGRSPNRFGLAFRLKPDAAQRFAEITRSNIGKRMAIVSRGTVLTVAEIRSEISTEAVVSAQLDREAVEAQLARILQEDRP